MNKLEEARKLLQELGVPPRQQADLCCYVILAMSNVEKDEKWTAATNEWIRIHDILKFTSDKYGVVYAENSRETFRKQAIHHFRNVAFIEDNNLSTNSPNYRYRLTDEMLNLVRSCGTAEWETKKNVFLKNHTSLVDLYASKKIMSQMPVEINGLDFSFSTGAHNELQKAIIEEFAPRFAHGAECLYVGDTIAKDLVKN